MLFLIYAESSTFYKQKNNFVVEAACAEDAKSLAHEAMNDFYREKDQYDIEFNNIEVEFAYVFYEIKSIEQFDRTNQEYPLFLEDVNGSSYIRVNF